MALYSSTKIRYPEAHLERFLQAANDSRWACDRRMQPRSAIPSTWPAFEDWLRRFGPSFGGAHLTDWNGKVAIASKNEKGENVC